MLSLHPAFVYLRRDGSIEETELFARDDLVPDPTLYWRDVTDFAVEHGRVPRVVQYTPNDLYHPRTMVNIRRAYPGTYHKVG
jgi:hypothetical protein